MSRCDYDVVFYRVFCIALLCVAFTFTVILTNVFIDIDGLLFKKNKEKPTKLEKLKTDSEVIITGYRPQDTVYEYYDSYEDTERTKRSLDDPMPDPNEILQRIKDTQLKNILKKRLFNYIEQLSEETDNKKDKEKDILNMKRNKNNNRNKDVQIDTRNSEEKDIFKEKDNNNKESDEKNTNIAVIKDIQRLKNHKDIKKNDELLHLAIHNVILQGIVGHMDLKDVYRKAHELANKFDDSGEKVLVKDHNSVKNNELVDEIIDRKTLHEDTVSEKPKKKNEKNLMIKTLINITSLANDKPNQEVQNAREEIHSKESLNGVIKLIFNGKQFKFKNFDEITTIKPSTDKPSKTYIPDVNINHILNEYLKTMKGVNSGENINNRHKRNNEKYDVIDYLSQIEELSNEEGNTNETIIDVEDEEDEEIENFEEAEEEKSKENKKEENNNVNSNMLKEYLKEMRRRNRIAYDTVQNKYNLHIINKRNSETSTEKPKGKDDDELFVEIETHFDSKGMKGDRKKKLIRELVDKIQKAIHADNPTHNKTNTTKRKPNNLHVKKRMQNPLDQEEKMRSVLNSEREMLVQGKLTHRHLDPISKIINMRDRIPQIYSNQEGKEGWRYYDDGPRFLTETKSINSVENNEYEAEFKQIIDEADYSPTDIPQRLQVPLMANGNPAQFYDLGDVRYLVKDIDDSGFSIGYNQYTDDPPDPESMKLFTGLENVIQTYHQNYDGDENINDDSGHEIVRRAIQDTDYHSNEYKIIFNNNFLPYKNYQDIFNQKINKKENNIKQKDKGLAIESIFNKELKPAEIFSLANLFNRKKRTVNVKKISNVDFNKKLNKYINTKAMKKRFIKTKKRSKRQVDKIRIIARDLPKNSEEDMFVLSDEKLLADRAVVKDISVNTPEVSNNYHQDDEHEHYNVIAPQKVTEDHYDIISPFLYEPIQGNHYSDSVFNKMSRHNALMSKYPHIFMEEINKGDDEYNSHNSVILHSHNVPKAIEYSTTVSTLNGNYYDQLNVPKPLYDDYGYDETPDQKNNYKVSVKVTPKNSSLHSGYKEVHTSINKSFNKNGLLYTSLVNVSELSKVEQANKARGYQHDKIHMLKQEHAKIRRILEQHRIRLAEQLTVLNDEKEKLDNIHVNFDINTDQMNSTGHDNHTDTNPKLTQENKHLRELKNISTTTTKAKAAYTSVFTEATTHRTTTPNIEKLIMFSSIQKNENITNQILTKINENNELLQTFLEKLASKLVTTTPKPTETPLPEPYEQLKTMFFKNRPLGVINDTMGIPFVYMYQHPVNASREPANIVYHGLIHSDAFNKYQKYKREEPLRTDMKDVKEINYFAQDPKFVVSPNLLKPNVVLPPNLVKAPNTVEGPKFVKVPNVAANNVTRFFLDEDTDFKILPVNTKNNFNTTTNK